MDGYKTNNELESVRNRLNNQLQESERLKQWIYGVEAERQTNAASLQSVWRVGYAVGFFVGLFLGPALATPLLGKSVEDVVYLLIGLAAGAVLGGPIGATIMERQTGLLASVRENIKRKADFQNKLSEAEQSVTNIRVKLAELERQKETEARAEAERQASERERIARDESRKREQEVQLEAVRQVKLKRIAAIKGELVEIPKTLASLESKIAFGDITKDIYETKKAELEKSRSELLLELESLGETYEVPQSTNNSTEALGGTTENSAALRQKYVDGEISNEEYGRLTNPVKEKDGA